jgi:hypothetical protein
MSGDEISKGFKDKIKDMFHNHYKEEKLGIYPSFHIVIQTIFD